jgi:hypothetical protein
MVKTVSPSARGISNKGIASAGIEVLNMNAATSKSTPGTMIESGQVNAPTIVLRTLRE